MRIDKDLTEHPWPDAVLLAAQRARTAGGQVRLAVCGPVLQIAFEGVAAAVLAGELESELDELLAAGFRECASQRVMRYPPCTHPGVPELCDELATEAMR